MVMVVDEVESGVWGRVWTRMRVMGPRTMGIGYVLSMMERCRDGQDEEGINHQPT